jgi:mono/diheme cytochrome c family protein
MLKPLVFVSALVLFGISATTIAGPLPQEKSEATASGQNSSSSKLSEKAEARTKTLYTQECVFCHGDNGNGKTDVAAGMKLTLDDWTDPKTLAGKNDKELFAIIRNGKGQMLAEPVGRAKDEEVMNLILYIRGFAKQGSTTTPEAAPATPAAVPATTN